MVLNKDLNANFGLGASLHCGAALIAGPGFAQSSAPPTFVMSTEATGVGHDSEAPVVRDYGEAPHNHFHGGTLGAILVSRSE